MRRVPPDPPSLSPALRGLVDRAYRSRGRQVRQIIALCRQYSSHYRALSGDALDGLRRNTDYLVSGFYRWGLIGGRKPLAAELDLPTRMARLRAAQGVPLPEMIGCYQMGLPMLWADLVASVGTDAHVLRELLQRVPASISGMTLVTTAVTEAYVEERERLLRSRDEAIDEMLRLLDRDETSANVLEVRARALGIGLEEGRSAVIFRPAAGDEDTDSALVVDRIRHLFEDQPSCGDVVVGRIRGGILALLSLEPDRSRLSYVTGKLPGRGWRAGVGNPGAGAEGVRRSIREAARALEIGELLSQEGPIHRYAELTILDLVDVGSPRARDFARRVLGTLADRGASDTHLRTLGAVCRSGFHLKLAAASLGIHPHTLSYRLSQIRRRFGLDLDDAETRLRVHLAVLILDN